MTRSRVSKQNYLHSELASVPNQGRRNLLHNGDFKIDQRRQYNTYTIVAGSQFIADRWNFYGDTNAVNTFTAQTRVFGAQDGEGDLPPGFSKGLKVNVAGTSGSDIPAGSEALFRQKIEGFDTDRLAYGTSSAKDLTVSFYVKSSLTGDFGLAAEYQEVTTNQKYHMQKSYTINSANTWERKTVTIPGNTANVPKYKSRTGVGLILTFDWGQGATYSSAVTNSWGTTYSNGLTGGVKLLNNNGATWYITGIQAEAGNTMTDFEFRSHAEELKICQNYFILMYYSATAHNAGYNNSYGNGRVFSMRAQPTASLDPASTKHAYPGNVQNSSNMVTEVNAEGAIARSGLGSGFGSVRWVFQGNSSYQYFDARTLLDADL